MSDVRSHRAAVFARRDAGETITTVDLIDADARDDAADPEGAVARLRAQADAVTRCTGVKHFVWSVPTCGLRPAALRVLPKAYAKPGWVAL